ncbi:MAG TPA: hypothetical protein PKM73_20430 [Verrucomicrobiota bacterium]|nr:hypothetical protein [Verrucomicrobiota bacterium]
MNETSSQQNDRIHWPNSLRNLALGLWAMGTYVALLGGIAWLAVAAGDPSPRMVATLAVIGTSFANLILFAAIERGNRD